MVGIKFTRDYNDIVNDMSHAIPNIDQFYRFLDMEKEQWEALSMREQHECTKTMCDDLFFALGSISTIEIEGGWVSYERTKNVITVNSGETVIAIIHLF